MTTPKKKGKTIQEVGSELAKPQAKSAMLEQLAELKEQKEILKREKKEQIPMSGACQLARGLARSARIELTRGS